LQPIWLADRKRDETNEIRKRRMAQLASRPVTAGMGYGLDTVASQLALGFGRPGGM